MHDTGKDESYGPGHLTFDCPWCGAISGVKPELVGEHFECVECGKETKLTDQNTRHAHLFEAPRDAPHHDDSARPFTCPWCGHHADIPPTHLGEYYDCAECHKRTKLTERTLPDAEALAEKEEAAAEHHAVWPIGLAAVIVIGAVLWALLGTGGDDGDGTSQADRENERGGGETVEAADLPETPAESDTPNTSATEPEDVAEESTSMAQRLAEARLGKATAAASEARSALDAWMAAHPELVGEVELQSVREALHERAQSLLRELDVGALGPKEARAFNEQLRTFVGSDPKRIALAEALLVQLAKQPVRPAPSASWEQLNYHAPRVREILEDQIGAARAGIPDEYFRLERVNQEAMDAEAAAREELAAASSE